MAKPMTHQFLKLQKKTSMLLVTITTTEANYSNNRGFSPNNNQGNNRGGQNNQTFNQNNQNNQTTYSSNRGNSQRGGRQRGGKGGNDSQRGGRQSSSFLQGHFCEFCGKEGHREDKCYTKIK